MKHTPGKLQYSEDLSAIVIINTKEHRVQAIADFGKIENHIANAQRLVDCWNACEGLNPKAVPELLEACKAVVDDWHSHAVNFYKIEPEYLKAIRQAIALAEPTT